MKSKSINLETLVKGPATDWFFSLLLTSLLLFSFLSKVVL
jgi:hypothetical protein